MQQPGQAARQRVLFDGKDLLLRANLHDDRSNLVVTFSPRSLAGYSPGPGFAEVPLNKQAVNNLVFIAKWNHWWQTAEMAEALAIARDFLAPLGLQRLSAYGSSMGGYGALMCAGELGCTHVLALGPQYSIDPAKVPFEKRWRREARLLRFERDDMDAALQSPARKFVVYDRQSADGPQMALMRGRNLHCVDIAGGGHAIAKYFKETGQLKPLLAAVIDGRLAEEMPELVRAGKKARMQSPAYMISLLNRLDAAPQHRRTARRLAWRFIEAFPRNFKLRNRLAGYLLEQQRYAQAREQAELACECNRSNPSSLLLLREILARQGDELAVAEVDGRIAGMSDSRAGSVAG